MKRSFDAVSACKTVVLGLLLAISGLFFNSGSIYAQAHFSPGVPNIRDLIVPEPGYYGVIYNYWYGTDRLNDNNGNKISSITINPGGGTGVTLDLKVDANIYALAPTFIWVSNWKLAGARYAAYTSPTFSNSSLEVLLSTSTGRGGNIEAGQFAAGDLYVKPLWLGWSTKHVDVAAGYGFYAPVGKYEVNTIELPIIGPRKIASPDNVGLGFWTNEIQGSVAVYPFENKGSAITSALNLEINGKQRDLEINPGEYMTWVWGFSQYLPLTKNQTLMAEVGPAGYSQWQVSDDTGSDVRDGTAHTRVHAAGVQAGLAVVPWNFSLNFRYLNEFSARNRVQGQSYGFSAAIKF